MTKLLYSTLAFTAFAPVADRWLKRDIRSLIRRQNCSLDWLTCRTLIAVSRALGAILGFAFRLSLVPAAFVSTHHWLTSLAMLATPLSIGTCA